jgi:thiamine-phosphate pyrophosphorylase
LDRLRLCLVTDRRQSAGADLAEVVRTCLDAGLPCVQVREKDLPAREVAALCRLLLPDVRRHGALLAVNDRLDVALAVGADAVQRTGNSLSVTDMRRVAGKTVLIGASTHSVDEALKAETAGADWVVFGPVYDTPSKRPYGPPQGLRALERVAARCTVPVVAIGGITPARVREVCGAGAAGVAVISAILGAPSPGRATRLFLDALEQGLPSAFHRRSGREHAGQSARRPAERA